jgi:hypothetical protein
MQRLTARFLLLFALVGTFLPMALDATSAPMHACCRRTGAHHCTDSSGTSDEPTVRDTSCCNHNCAGAVTTARWAHAQPASASVVSHPISIREGDRQRNAPASAILSARFTRGPPRLFIA